MKPTVLLLVVLLTPRIAVAQGCEMFAHDGRGLAVGYELVSTDRADIRGPAGALVLGNGLAVSGHYSLISLDGVDRKAQEVGGRAEFGRRFGHGFGACAGIGIRRGWLDGLSSGGPRSGSPFWTLLEQRTLAFPLSVGTGWEAVRRDRGNLVFFGEGSRTYHLLSVRRFHGVAEGVDGVKVWGEGPTERTSGVHWEGSLGLVATFDRFVLTPWVARALHGDRDSALGLRVGLRF